MVTTPIRCYGTFILVTPSAVKNALTICSIYRKKKNTLNM